MAKKVMPEVQSNGMGQSMPKDQASLVSKPRLMGAPATAGSGKSHAKARLGPAKAKKP